MQTDLLEKIAAWHDADEHQKIVDAIAALPEGVRDYQLTCLLARALNNLGDYKTAISFLFSVAKEGQQDSLWHYRMGYAYYYMGKEEKALHFFEKALELNPQEEDALLFITWCQEAIARQNKESAEEYDPELYEENELSAVEAHIEKYFGAFPSVFHELVSPDIHVDVAVIEPNEERPYYTLMTIGMGAHAMTMPEELSAEYLDRAEVFLCLPPDWPITGKEETDYWPIRLLKVLARLPVEEDSWLGWGHSIAHGEPFAKNTSFCGCLLLEPQDTAPGAEECVLPNGERVLFYQVIPLYQQELDYKIAHGVGALLEKMANETDVIEIGRPNAIPN